MFAYCKLEKTCKIIYSDSLLSFLIKVSFNINITRDKKKNYERKFSCIFLMFKQSIFCGHSKNCPSEINTLYTHEICFD